MLSTGDCPSKQRLVTAARLFAHGMQISHRKTPPVSGNTAGPIASPAGNIIACSGRPVDAGCASSSVIESKSKRKATNPGGGGHVLQRRPIIRPLPECRTA